MSSTKKPTTDKSTPVSASSGTSGGVLSYDAPDVVEVDADGVLLPIAIRNGLTVVIPLWPNHARDNTRTDELRIYLDDVLVFSQGYPGPITQPEFRILIEPRFLTGDSVELSYETITEGNLAFSLKKPLIIRLLQLSEPTFTSASLFGYLNCKSEPRIWDAVPVKIPVPTRVTWRAGDECRVTWQGYASLNLSGPIIVDGTFSRILTAGEVSQGMEFNITPFNRYIEPLEENASASATYRLYRSGVVIAGSAVAHVKVDRKESGKPGFCTSEADLKT